MGLPAVQFLLFLYHLSTDNCPIQLDKSSAATERIFSNRVAKFYLDLVVIRNYTAPSLSQQSIMALAGLLFVFGDCLW
jgi:hypothetical protein